MNITRVRLRLRFASPALFLACLALLAALGGGTYDAAQSSASGIHFANAKLQNSWNNIRGGWSRAARAARRRTGHQ
jgi:hypothetical protein